MPNDGKIYITISDKRFGQNKAEADEQNKLDKEKSKNKESGASKFVEHQAFHLIESQAKKAVNYTINNIGNFTGDYMAQTHVSDAVSIISYVSQIGVATVAGAKLGGWLGALLGAVGSLAGGVISRGLEIANEERQIDKQNRDIAMLRTRAGLNSTNNGNRGTEY